eukprot:CAMPEP_0116904074 /NCGR_PEP_ID=MMETSP0467-20121206/11167_1 /TAXON_ID=283647 /ORGANISM="Mesodinium pulex, Strain SPMC105" /LENGTH=147 /DNA_ID=CAMNT_0004578579 /DNA_START=1256 /DNA_END=1698 /DNA_ORIENTATION=+
MSLKYSMLKNKMCDIKQMLKVNQTKMKDDIINNLSLDLVKHQVEKQIKLEEHMVEANQNHNHKNKNKVDKMAINMNMNGEAPDLELQHNRRQVLGAAPVDAGSDCLGMWAVPSAGLERGHQSSIFAPGAAAIRDHRLVSDPESLFQY